MRDASTVMLAIQAAEVVFYLSASVGDERSIDSAREEADINLLDTLQVLEALRRPGVLRTVFPSSAGVFGDLRTLPMRQDHLLDPRS